MADAIIMVPPGFIELETESTPPLLITSSNKTIHTVTPPGWGRGGKARVQVSGFDMTKLEQLRVLVDGEYQGLTQVEGQSIEFWPSAGIKGRIGDKAVVSIGDLEYPDNLVSFGEAELTTTYFDDTLAVTFSLDGNGYLVGSVAFSGRYINLTGSESMTSRWVTLVIDSTTTKSWKAETYADSGGWEELYFTITNGVTATYSYFINPESSATPQKLRLTAQDPVADAGTIVIREYYVGTTPLLGWSYIGLMNGTASNKASASGTSTDAIIIQQSSHTGWNGTALFTPSGTVPYSYSNPGMCGASADSLFLCGGTTGTTSTARRCYDYDGTSYTYTIDMYNSSIAIDPSRGASLGTQTDANSVCGSEDGFYNNNANWNGSSWTAIPVLPGSDYTFYFGQWCGLGTTTDHVLYGGWTGSAPATHVWDGTAWASMTAPPAQHQAAGGFGASSSDFRVFGGGLQPGEYTFDGTAYATSAHPQPVQSEYSGHEGENSSNGLSVGGYHRGHGGASLGQIWLFSDGT